MFNFDQQTADFGTVTAFFTEQIATIRTGRAVPALVERVAVEAYDSKMPLVQLATINVHDARTIIVQPWDKSQLKAIETALRTADLGVSPAVDGDVIRLSMPALTEENRKQLVKLLHQRTEEARVRARQHREKVKSEIHKAHSEGGVTEDEKFRLEKKLDEKVRAVTDELDALANAKEKEIMTL